MGLLGWLRGRSGRGDGRLDAWRRKWSIALDGADYQSAGALEAELGALGLPADDIEVEREMLEALHELLRLRAELDSSGLPAVETGHRVIGADVCHFTAPASMPDDQTQPAGRLLLTNARAVFAGGSRTKSLPWHGVARVVQSDRDIVLIAKDHDTLHRFRCNTYGEATRGALIARTLVAQSRSGNAGYPPAAHLPKNVER